MSHAETRIHAENKGVVALYGVQDCISASRLASKLNDEVFLILMRYSDALDE